MHTFQPADTSVLEVNPFQKIGKDWMLVTAGDEQKVNTMTASWGGLGVAWGCDVAFVFIRQTRYTKEFIDKTGKFSLSFPTDKYRREMKILGALSGRNEDKIGQCGVHVGFHNGIPYIDEANLVITCTVLSATELTMDQMVEKGIEKDWYSDGNIHTMYIAKIEDVLVR